MSAAPPVALSCAALATAQHDCEGQYSIIDASLFLRAAVLMTSMMSVHWPLPATYPPDCRYATLLQIRWVVVWGQTCDMLFSLCWPWHARVLLLDGYVVSVPHSCSVGQEDIDEVGSAWSAGCLEAMHGGRSSRCKPCECGLWCSALHSV